VGVSNRSLTEWRSRVHPEDGPRVLEDFQRAFHGGSDYEVEYRVVWPNGSLHWIASKGTVLKDEGGKPVRAIGVSYDITPRKAAEEEIRRLLNQAEARERELRDKQEQLIQTAKLAGLGELATGVAHELNNPLNNIGLFIGNALDRIRQPGPDLMLVGQELERSLGQVKKAATIIKHLRTFGRMAPREREAVPLNDLVTNALSLVHEQFRLRGIDIRLDLSPSAPRTMANRIQLEQVFVNLLTNARDAVQSTEHKSITIRTALHGDHVEVEVRDSGHGIPTGEQARVFDPFYTTKDVGQGTGLGLSISYGIVKEHKGQITVDSRPGHGATFRITLPALIPESAEVSHTGQTTV
jgi:C4-dicarboxylate-specific signal transduction histidine kinase